MTNLRAVGSIINGEFHVADRVAWHAVPVGTLLLNSAQRVVTCGQTVFEAHSSVDPPVYLLPLRAINVPSNKDQTVDTRTTPQNSPKRFRLLTPQNSKYTSKFVNTPQNSIIHLKSDQEINDVNLPNKTRHRSV